MTWIKICGITNLEDALSAIDAGANALGFVFYPKSPRYITADAARTIVDRLPPAMEKVGVFVNETAETISDIAKRVGLTAVQLHGDESVEFSRALFRDLADHRVVNGVVNEVVNKIGDRSADRIVNGSQRPTIFRTWPAKIFEAPVGQPEGWDPVKVGLVEPDEAYKGKRVHKIHVAENGDLFLETHGFRPGVISGVLLDSSSEAKRGGTGQTFDWEQVQPWAGIINSISKLIVAGGLRPGNVQEAIHLLHPWGVDVSSGVEREPGKKDPGKVRAFVQAVRDMEEAS